MSREILTNATGNAAAGNEGTFSLGEFRLVCDAAASGQSLTFMERGGVQAVIYREYDTRSGYRLPMSKLLRSLHGGTASEETVAGTGLGWKR